jgi:hypothetical protein
VRKVSPGLFGLIATIALVGAALAQSSANFALPWNIFAGGGGSTGSTNYGLNSSVGPGPIGGAESANYRVGSGFWYGVDAIGPTTPSAPTSTATPSSSATPTATLTSLPPGTASPTPTATPTAGTPTPSATSAVSGTPTLSPTVTSVPAGTPTPSPTLSPGGTQHWVYVPLVLRNPMVVPSPTPTVTGTLTPGATGTPTTTPEPGIHGRVTYTGAPADGIQLTLRLHAGIDWTDVATTVVGADGSYRFTGAASLDPGQQYQVRYGINASNENYLYAAYGLTLSSYTSGESVWGGDLDIANVHLSGPAAGASLPLPVTFTWEPRGIIGDAYRFILFEPAGNGQWTTGDLGAVGSFTLTSLPAGAAFGHQYRWFVRVYSASGTYGDSFRYPTITFVAE